MGKYFIETSIITVTILITFFLNIYKIYIFTLASKQTSILYKKKYIYFITYLELFHFVFVKKHKRIKIKMQTLKGEFKIPKQWDEA